MTREDIDRIASEYFDDKESEHEMDEVFDLVKKALEERKDDMLDKIREEIEELEEGIMSYYNDRPWIFKDEVLAIIDKYRESKE